MLASCTVEPLCLNCNRGYYLKPIRKKKKELI